MVYRKVWKDPWFRKLGTSGRLLWLYLLTPGEDISYCGFIEVDLELMSFASGIPADEIDSLLARFAEDEKIYRENNCLLIKNFIPYQAYNANSLESCRKDADEWQHRCPNLVEKARLILQNPREIRIGNGSEGFGRVPNDSEGLGIVPNGTLLSYPNPNTKAKANTKAKGDGAAAPELDLHPQYGLARECIEMILTACTEHGLGEAPNNDLAQCCKTLDQVIRLDKLTVVDIKATLAWALQDSFWQTLILSIPKWRNKGNNGRPKFCNCWSSWRKAMSPQSVSASPISNGKAPMGSIAAMWENRGKK